MTLDAAKNFAKVTVSTGYDASATSIVLSSGHGAKLPATPFNVTWWDSNAYPDPSDDPNVEVVRVTNISTDTLTVTRAQEGTSATTKNTGGGVYKMVAALTAKVINTDLSATYAPVGAIEDLGNSGTAKNVDWSNKQYRKKITTTGSCTLTFTGAPPTTATLQLIIIHESGTTPYTYTWPASVKWAGGLQFVTTNVSGAIDVVTLTYDGTSTYYAVGNAQFG